MTRRSQQRIGHGTLTLAEGEKMPSLLRRSKPAYMKGFSMGGEAHDAFVPVEGDVDTESLAGRSASGPEVHLREQIAKLQAEKGGMRNHLKKLDALWERRRQPLQEGICRLDSEIMALQRKLKVLQAPMNEMPPAPGPTYFSWVDDAWFSHVCNLIVFLNLVCMAESAQFEQAHLLTLQAVLDQLFLVWYVCELGAKARYHQRNLFLGKLSLVWWNWLDSVIVVSGVLDQWFMPLVGPSSNLGVMKGLRALRIFRVLRVLRLLKAFLLGDLSWTEKPPFEVFMAGVIAVNSITMWLELDYDWPIWPYVENLFLVIYFFELSVRIKHMGCGYFTNLDSIIWNMLDFVMVVGGMLDLWLIPMATLIEGMISGKTHGKPAGFSGVLSLLKMMRILRVLRLVRLLRTIKPLYRLLVGVMEALMAMQWVMVLTLLVLYAGAITWTTLVGKGILNGPSNAAQEYFGTVPSSLFSLFKLMNGDTSVVEPITDTAVGQLMFAAFMVLSNWAVLAILTSVVSDNMMTSSAKAAEEDLAQHHEAERQLRAERLLDLFHGCDRDRSGLISAQEWNALLEDPVRGGELLDATALTRRVLQDTFESAARPNAAGAGRLAGFRGQVLAYEKFILQLDEAATPADNRSLMHVTSQLRDVQEQVNQMSKAIASCSLIFESDHAQQMSEALASCKKLST